MWCDNCLLVFPLRHGALALGGFIALYSLIGGILIFKFGQYYFFVFPDYQIWGGISMGVMAIALITCIGISNMAAVWLRLSFLLWPVILIIVAVRMAIMGYELNQNQSKIFWECEHNGIMWNNTIANYTNEALSNLNMTTLPLKLCPNSKNFHTFFVAACFSFAVDFILQCYFYFLTWRVQTKLSKYLSYKLESAGLYTSKY